MKRSATLPRNRLRALMYRRERDRARYAWFALRAVAQSISLDIELNSLLDSDEHPAHTCASQRQVAELVKALITLSETMMIEAD